MTATCIGPLGLEGVIQAIGTDRALPHSNNISPTST